jgi:cysteine-rich repeat protein
MEISEGDTIYLVISGVPTTNSRQGTGSFELTFVLTPDPELGGPCVSPNAGGRACPEGSECQEPVDGEAICGTPVCGDGYLGFIPFMCEDSNTQSGDGCSETCAVDAQGAGSSTCSDPVTLNLPRSRGILDDGLFFYAGGMGDFVAGSDLDASCSAAAGPEVVYVFELPVASQVDISGQNGEVLSLRRAEVASCGTEELDCVTGDPSSALALSFPMLEAGRYAIVLDREEPTAATTDSYVVDVFATPIP